MYGVIPSPSIGRDSSSWEEACMVLLREADREEEEIGRAHV
jgi:hypothetical protein